MVDDADAACVLANAGEEEGTEAEAVVVDVGRCGEGGAASLRL